MSDPIHIPERSRVLARLPLVLVLVLLTGLALGAALSLGEARTIAPSALLPALAKLLGLGSQADPLVSALVEIRLWRAVVAILVGASLALSGALLQGLFRNPLAAPSLLGVTSGASFGVALAMLCCTGLGPAPMWLGPAAAFAGAGASLVLLLAAALGPARGSMALLLLIGIALASLWSGLVAFVQNLALDRFDVTQVLLRWSFGDLDDRHPEHAGVAALCLLPGVLAIPWIARPLDILAMGEDDARTLGVDPDRLRIVVVLLASAATAGAVAVAGPIAFVGLVVPNLVRMATGSAHDLVLPASLVAGGGFLLCVDTAQRSLWSRGNLPPGVALSLVGAPFFLWLLWRQRRELASW